MTRYQCGVDAASRKVDVGVETTMDMCIYWSKLGISDDGEFTG